MNNKNTNTLISLAFMAVVITILLTACGSSSTPSQGTGQVPSSSTSTQDSVQGNGSVSGQTLMDVRCSVCHSTSRITSAQKTLDEWTNTVDRMINKGAQLNADEKQILIDYLAANFK
jgi:cytochrome c5